MGHFSTCLPSQINWIVSSLSKLPLCDSEVFLFSEWYLLIKEFYSKCSNISCWLKNNQRNQTASRSSPFAFTCRSRKTEMGFPPPSFFPNWARVPVAEALEALNCSVLNCRDATTGSECFQHTAIFHFILKALNSLSSYFFYLVSAQLNC